MSVEASKCLGLVVCGDVLVCSGLNADCEDELEYRSVMITIKFSFACICFTPLSGMTAGSVMGPALNVRQSLF